MSLKEQMKKALQENDLAAASALINRDRKALSHLIRLAYAKDTLVGWRAILAVGVAARELVNIDAAFLRETCRKLLWSLSDESGGIGWAAPELLGEIVSADPGRFEDIVPLIASVYEVEEDVFRSGVLYALDRIAEMAPALVAVHKETFLRSLADRDPMVRARGIGLISKLWTWARVNTVWSTAYCDQVRSAMKALKGDTNETWIYDGDKFISVVIGKMANNALNLIG